MMGNGLKVLISTATFIFSLACGFFLVRFIIPLYFLFFPAIPKALDNFYIGMGIFAFLLLLLDIVLFRIGKYNWGIWVSGMAILLIGFGTPLFMLDNNDMLWQQAVQARRGPVYFIEFSDAAVRSLQAVKNLFGFIWNKVYLFVYAYLVLYLATCVYLSKKEWRIRGVRIKY
jgi:hypothetical protein